MGEVLRIPNTVTSSLARIWGYPTMALRAYCKVMKKCYLPCKRHCRVILLWFFGQICFDNPSPVSLPIYLLLW